MLDKAFLLLNILARVQDSTPLGVSELARRSGLAKSTVHRLLQQLSDQDLATTIEDGYVLGDRVSGWANSIGQGADLPRLRHTAVPYLVELHATFPEAVISLGVLSGARVRYLDCVHGHHPPPVPALTVWAPAHCTAIGKLLLAYHHLGAIAEVLGSGPYPRYTAHTRCTPTELDTELLRIRQRGFAVDWKEFHPGLVCASAPVHTRHHRAVAAISISGAAPATMHPILGHLRHAAASVSRTLG
ncbi:IclR family transcriptional regulator [Nocardia brasiliensis]